MIKEKSFNLNLKLLGTWDNNDTVIELIKIFYDFCYELKYTVNKILVGKIENTRNWYFFLLIL